MQESKDHLTEFSNEVNKGAKLEEIKQLVDKKR